ncbi:hypothetical protein KCP75_13090 [Salmonella enterica subsp. enterica]|nr:hypothetical protein KCP75_13090 [Salmonella enterica subsp. enterica]
MISWFAQASKDADKRRPLDGSRPPPYGRVCTNNIVIESDQVRLPDGGIKCLSGLLFSTSFMLSSLLSPFFHRRSWTLTRNARHNHRTCRRCKRV